MKKYILLYNRLLCRLVLLDRNKLYVKKYVTHSGNIKYLNIIQVTIFNTGYLVAIQIVKQVFDFGIITQSQTLATIDRILYLDTEIFKACTETC